MASTNTPYIAKAAAPLVNTTAATLFTTAISPIATVASTQVPKVAFVCYKDYAQFGAGVSNNINLAYITVRAAGRVTYGAAGNFTPTLVLGSVGTTSNFLVGSSTINIGAPTVQAASGAGTGLWEVEATLLWDPNTGLIVGTYRGLEGVLVAGTGSQTITGITTITPITGFSVTPTLSVNPSTTQAPIPSPTGENVLFFGVSGIFSASNANNQATMDMFESEAL